MDFPQLVLKSGRDKSVRNRHPWVFSGGIKSAPKCPEGTVVAVHATNGDFLGLGHFAPGRSIACRMFHFGAEAPALNTDFWQGKLQAALDYRLAWLDRQQTTGFRLLHAEGDGFPGVILDIYGDAASLQLRSAGAISLLPEIQQFLDSQLGIRHLYLQTEKDEQVAGGGGDWLQGGAPEFEFLENGHRFLVDIEHGQKTGFFLDQRDNRATVGEFAAGRTVLNAFSYTGGFSIYALAGGAREVVSLDASAHAATWAERNVQLNAERLDPSRHEAVQADCFKYLQDMPEDHFDMVILDPPAFAKHKSAVDRAARGYKDINLKALKKMKPGSWLLTFSCSQHISTDLFRKIVFSACADAGREARIARQFSQAPDHPVNLYHPEGEYLKGLMLYIR